MEISFNIYNNNNRRGDTMNAYYRGDNERFDRHLDKVYAKKEQQQKVTKLIAITAFVVIILGTAYVIAKPVMQFVASFFRMMRL